MRPGKLGTAGMAMLAPERREPYRPPPTATEQRIGALEHREAVLRECLEIAMRGLAFAAMPPTRQDLRSIRERLSAAGIEVRA